MPRHDYRLIVFDWDGTLMDSAAKIVRCFESAVIDVGVPSPGDAAIRHIIGLGLNEAIEALLPDCDSATRVRVIDRYRDHFLHLDQTEMPLFPGVRAGLEDLAERGYLLAVATGKARRGLARVLEDTGLGGLFVASRCADESFSKPHPQMLLDILDDTGTDARAAVMIGDTIYDMEMARNAGVDSLAVSYGVHARDQLLAHSPRGCFESFVEVHEWLR
ncbi:MAG: HAD-IA family hydrolase [Pseudomonadota bacterium]|nr:MAG: HAD-IA family hydrolase [Pseudomonadota bacterium]